MSKRKFAYNVATLAVATWNTTRLVEALHEQSAEIARKVTIEMAQQKLKARRQGRDAVAGIARDVFEEMRDIDPMHAVDGGIVVDRRRLERALASVVERALA